MFSLLVVLCNLIIAFLMLFAIAELLSVFLDANDLIIKIMLLPFLVAFISFLAKFIFSMLKKKIVIIFYSIRSKYIQAPFSNYFIC